MPFRSFKLGAAGVDAGDPNTGTGGGLHRGLTAPREPLSSLTPAGGTSFSTPGGRRRRIPGPDHVKVPRPAAGMHERAVPVPRATRTAEHPVRYGEIVAGRRQPSAADPLLHRLLEQSAASLNPSTGQVFGHGFGAVFALGHHPQATGRLAHPVAQASAHHGTVRRAVVVDYNAGANSATVRFADTPDSPTVSLPVSAAIAPATMSAATMAGVQIYDAADPTDAVITHVLE